MEQGLTVPEPGLLTRGQDLSPGPTLLSGACQPVVSPHPSRLSLSPVSGSVESGRKLHVIPRAKKGAEGQPPGHSSHVLCMAISSDGKYLVRQGWPWGWVRGLGTRWVPAAIVLIPTGLGRPQQAHPGLGGPELPAPAHLHGAPGCRVGEGRGLLRGCRLST